MTSEQSNKPHNLASSPEPIREIDILWITAGLGCDGDTIAVTAATQPSLEDIVLEALPVIPQRVAPNRKNGGVLSRTHQRKMLLGDASELVRYAIQWMEQEKSQ